jgi:hypothetical protein
MVGEPLVAAAIPAGAALVPRFATIVSTFVNVLHQLLAVDAWSPR